MNGRSSHLATNFKLEVTNLLRVANIVRGDDDDNVEAALCECYSTCRFATGTSLLTSLLHVWFQKSACVPAQKTSMQFALRSSTIAPRVSTSTTLIASSDHVALHQN